MGQRNWISLGLAALIYALLWIGWQQHWEWLVSLDTEVLGILRYEDGSWVQFWDALCTVLSPNSFRIITSIIVVGLLIRRHWSIALFLVVSIELSGLVIVLAKHAADRPRPGMAMVYAYGSSFPSGHALAAMVGVLTLLTVFLKLVPTHWRVVLVVVGGVIVAAVGIGRVVLGVHYPSDVVAGWALGYLYYGVCVAIMRPVPFSGSAAVSDR